MKTKLLIIIAIAIFSSYIFFSLYSSNENAPYSLPSLNCGEKYIQRGNACHLDPAFIEKNTIIIYDVMNNGKPRLSVAPHAMMMNLTNGNTVTFVNEGSNTIKILDTSTREKWRFENVEPSSQRILTINETGFYGFLTQNTYQGTQGRIVVLSEDTNSLLLGIRAKMAQAIVSMDFDKRNIGVISVGLGGGAGVTIGIDEKFQGKHEDGLKFYYEYFDNLIPFDVPITIEFQEPITFR